MSSRAPRIVSGSFFLFVFWITCTHPRVNQLTKIDQAIPNIHNPPLFTLPLPIPTFKEPDLLTYRDWSLPNLRQKPSHQPIGIEASLSSDRNRAINQSALKPPQPPTETGPSTYRDWSLPNLLQKPAHQPIGIEASSTSDRNRPINLSGLKPPQPPTETDPATYRDWSHLNLRQKPTHQPIGIEASPTSDRNRAINLSGFVPDAEEGLEDGAQSRHEERGGEKSGSDRVREVSTKRVRDYCRHGQGWGQTDQHMLETWGDKDTHAYFICDSRHRRDLTGIVRDSELHAYCVKIR